MTSYRRINSRTINRDVRELDNMAVFMKPISNAIYPDYPKFSVPDASLNSLLISTGSPYNATASSKLKFNGTTLDVYGNLDVSGNADVSGDLHVTGDADVTGNSDVSGKFHVEGNADVSGNLNVLGNSKVTGNSDVSGKLHVVGNADVSGNLNVLGNSNVSGNSEVTGNLQVAGNVLSYGTIQALQFLPGQVVNIAMLSSADLSQSQITIGSGQTLTVFSFSYTPKILNSYLLFEYQTIYIVGGSSNDEIVAYMNVVDTGDNRIASTYQRWTSAGGGGTRSGTMFPIVGRYTNATVGAKTVRVDVFNNTDTDNVIVQSNNSTWLKITEIGR